MNRNQRFPHARRQRRPILRVALIGGTLAMAALLFVPAAMPRGTVLDLRGQGAAQNAIAQGPTTETSATLPPLAATIPAITVALVSPTAVPSIDPRLWNTDRPTAIGRGVPPSRLASEIRGTRAPSIEILTGYRWPVARVRLTLPFGPTPWGSRLVGGKTFHDGVDLATFCGDRVMAAHDGVVLAAGRHYDAYMGWIGDLGPYLRRLDRNHLWMTLPIMVVTDDGNGYRSMYAHFGKVVVKPGDVVKAGQLLGYEGATGRASGCHVHYGLFSPWETATFRIKPDVAKRMKVPAIEIARVDPLLILPPKAGVNAPKVSTAPMPTPSPMPTP